MKLTGSLQVSPTTTTTTLTLLLLMLGWDLLARPSWAQAQQQQVRVKRSDYLMEDFEVAVVQISRHDDREADEQRLLGEDQQRLDEEKEQEEGEETEERQEDDYEEADGTLLGSEERTGEDEEEAAAAFPQDPEAKMRKINELLNMIESQAMQGENCTPGTELDLGEEVVDSYGQERFQAAALISVNRANWLTRLWKYARSSIENSEFLLHSSLIEMMEANDDIFAAGNCYDKQQYKEYFLFCPFAYRLSNGSILVKDLAREYDYLSNTSEFFFDARRRAEQIVQENNSILKGFHANNINESHTTYDETEILSVQYKDGQWTKPYYDCGGGNIWMMTFTVPFFGYDQQGQQYIFKGTSGIDIDLRRVDINQCHVNGSSFNIFGGTDKCKKETTTCVPLTGLGFRRGSYTCVCKTGFYFPNTEAIFKNYNGTILEEEYEKKLMGANWTYYDNFSSFQCLACAEGCDDCVDASPCIVSLNMVLRSILLVLQCVIIGCLPVVVLFTYKYSELKVVKAASPLLLRIIILGAFFIYSTTIVLYPRPNMLTCTLRIWLREIGFALSYGALMLKTWRISVIFRVRSAKAVKITDMDLIKRLGIILGIFVLFLLIRTLVSPPEVIIGRTAEDLKAFLCQSDWWDHSFTILEFLFLLWGIRLCIKVRKAPSEFNESRFISMTIYNEFLLSIFLNVSMFFLQHPANPDLLYIIFFCHSQLTITILLCLIFASKFYLVMKGQGKDLEEISGGGAKAFQKKFNKPGLNRSGSTAGGGAAPLAGRERNSLSSEGAINAELNKMLMTLKVLQEKNAASGSIAVSKKIMAIQEAFASSPRLPSSGTNNGHASLLPSHGTPESAGGPPPPHHPAATTCSSCSVSCSSTSSPPAAAAQPPTALGCSTTARKEFRRSLVYCGEIGKSLIDMGELSARTVGATAALPSAPTAITSAAAVMSFCPAAGITATAPQTGEREVACSTEEEEAASVEASRLPQERTITTYSSAGQPGAKKESAEAAGSQPPPAGLQAEYSEGVASCCGRPAAVAVPSIPNGLVAGGPSRSMKAAAVKPSGPAEERRETAAATPVTLRVDRKDGATPPSRPAGGRPGPRHRYIINLDDKNKFTDEVTV